MFQLTAARRRLVAFKARLVIAFAVSTHSRPKAAGQWLLNHHKNYCVSTHSRPKAAGKQLKPSVAHIMFQLTAARRRLEN